jgi:hypothetical protein
MKAKFINPIAGEEWIEKFREKEFWIGERKSYPQKFYSRLAKSYLGWWLYFRIHNVWGRGALLIDPLSCGGFCSHLRCFLYNLIIVDIYWSTKHRIWKIFHRRDWEKQRAFFAACSRAHDEGCADPMPPPAWLPKERFHGVVLGERYLKRVAEIMKEHESGH